MESIIDALSNISYFYVYLIGVPMSIFFMIMMSMGVYNIIEPFIGKRKFQASFGLRIISILMLILAIGDNTSSFYTSLRLVLFLSGAFSFQVYGSKRTWSILFLMITILFNPFYPLYLDKGLWIIIDIITVVIFLISLKYCYILSEVTDDDVRKAMDRYINEKNNS